MIWDLRPIIWKAYFRTQDDFGKPIKSETWATGWGVDAPGFGIADSYASAIALNMGLWDEYCAYHRGLK